MSHITIFLLFIFIILILQGFFIVDHQTCAIIERFGKFHKIATSGLNFKIPLIDVVKHRMSLRIHQLDVDVETKTKDDVFVHIVVAVQYRVLNNRVYDAFYSLNDPKHQITSFVFDLVRAQVPNLILDDVFSKKDNIANAIRSELLTPMSEFGYEIVNALVIDIAPDRNVKDAMNEINTAQRLRIAANEKGEAEKILKVKRAEAEAESSILHGKGIAGQRQAIIEGLGQSVEDFIKQIPGTDAKHVMDMVLLIQYIDTLKEMSNGGKSNIIFVPNSPGGVADLAKQIRETVFAAKVIDKE